MQQQGGDPGSWYASPKRILETEIINTQDCHPCQSPNGRACISSTHMHWVQMVQPASWHDPPSTQLIKTSFSSQSKTLKVSQQNPKKNSIIITQHTSKKEHQSHACPAHTQHNLSLSWFHCNNIPFLHDSTATKPTIASWFYCNTTYWIPSWFHSSNLPFHQPSRY
jgi:hypothetical protein